VSNLSAGGVREGGGTITMQLARNTCSRTSAPLRRKLKEAFLALRLEREFSKQEILTLYLNRIFLASARTASARRRRCISTSARRTDPGRGALIAGLRARRRSTTR